MNHISGFIEGTPLSRNRSGARKPGLQGWIEQVAKQTGALQQVENACILRVTFFLADEAYRTAPPYGPDLDNLLKPFLDALKKTVLQSQEDAGIISIQATKARAGPGQRPGALLEIFPIIV